MKKETSETEIQRRGYRPFGCSYLLCHEPAQDGQSDSSSRSSTLRSLPVRSLEREMNHSVLGYVGVKGVGSTVELHYLENYEKAVFAIFT